jgi:ABC-2 type transport system permease protein
MKFKNNFFVFLALLKKDVKVLLSNFKTVLIDSIVHSSCFILLFGYFLPALGMSKEYSLPMFLGSVLLTSVSTSYSRTIGIKSNLEFSKFINYHLTLPFTKNWLIAEYVAAFTFDLFLATFPIIIFGITILKPDAFVNFAWFMPIYLLSLLFFAILFMLIAFSTRWDWFINNVWERILNPLIQTGCVLYIWHNLFKFSPTLGNLVLLNPITYVAEGLRGSLLQSDIYISPAICISAILVLSIILFIFLIRSINKLLDPV